MTTAWAEIVFVIAGAGILAGCLMPERWMPPLPNDKLLHFLAYAGLSLLATKMAVNNEALAAWLGGLFIAGCLIEVLQKFVPGRGFSWLDLAANALGIVLVGGTVLIQGWVFGC